MYDYDITAVSKPLVSEIKKFEIKKFEVRVAWRGWQAWQHERKAHPFVRQRTGEAQWMDKDGVAVATRHILAVSCMHPNCFMDHAAEMWSLGDDLSYRTWMTKHWNHRAVHGVQRGFDYSGGWWPDAA
jgi:hypothetical protein